MIITHESDLDGLVSGVLLQRLARKLFNADVRLEAYHYHNWRQRELREKSGWIADLTFEPRMDRPNWVIIDHHATETPPKNALFIHDLTKSAGLICYELCQQQGLGSPALDRLVHLNNVADLFLEDDPDFILASDYANLVKIYQFWNLHALIGGEIEQLLNNPLLRVMEVKRNIEDPLGFAWSRENITEITPQVPPTAIPISGVSRRLSSIPARRPWPSRKVSTWLPLRRNPVGRQAISEWSRCPVADGGEQGSIFYSNGIMVLTGDKTKKAAIAKLFDYLYEPETYGRFVNAEPGLFLPGDRGRRQGAKLLE